MRFRDIPGHDDVKTRLIGLVDADRMPHALLLEGPAGAAKFALARATAQYIHCENRIKGVDSCGKCPSCLQHESFNHIDAIYSFPVIKDGSSNVVSDDYIEEFKELMSESEFMDFDTWLEKLDNLNAKPVIYVTEAAQLIHKLNYTTHSSKYKIVLMWLPERLNEEAANKLLKLIEEPHQDTIFIFSSDNSRQILPTIYSRTQRIGVKRYSDAEVSEWLQYKCNLDAADANQIAKLAAGNLNEALKLISVSKDRKKYLELFIDLMRKAYSRDVAGLKKWADNVADLGREREMQFLDFCARMVRENFILNMRCSELNCLNQEEMQFSTKFSPFINERNVLDLFKQLNDAKTDIAANALAKLVNFDLAVKVILLIKR